MHLSDMSLLTPGIQLCSRVNASASLWPDCDWSFPHIWFSSDYKSFPLLESMCNVIATTTTTFPIYCTISCFKCLWTQRQHIQNILYLFRMRLFHLVLDRPSVRYWFHHICFVWWYVIILNVGPTLKHFAFVIQL